MIQILILLLLFPSIVYGQVSVGGKDIENVRSIQHGGRSDWGVSPSGKARVYFDTDENKLKCSENGAAYVDCVGGGSMVGGTTVTINGVEASPAHIIDTTSISWTLNSGTIEASVLAVTDSMVPNNITIDLASSATLAVTSTSLASNGSNCLAGSGAAGVDEFGNSESCTNFYNDELEVEAVVDLQDLQGAVTDGQVPNSITIDLAASATLAVESTSLATNGSNCSAGSYALGVDVYGASEGCTDATTEISSEISNHAGLPDIHHEAVTFTGKNYLTIKDGQIINVGTVDISSHTNLTAGDALTLTDDDIDFDGGATPAGELGGTWASPTVDATHSGSAHHSAVTVSGTPDYITLSGQDIVRGTVDISDDTNLSAGSLALLSGDSLGVNVGTLTATKTCTYEASGKLVCNTTPAGAPSGWSDDGTEVRLDTSTDDVEIGSAGGISAKVGIQGDSDEIQLDIHGNATQTEPVFRIMSVANSTIFVLEQDGDMGWGDAAATGTALVTVNDSGSKRGALAFTYNATGGTVSANINSDLTLSADHTTSFGILSAHERNIDGAGTNNMYGIASKIGVTSTLVLTQGVQNQIAFYADDDQGTADATSSGGTVNKAGLYIDEFALMSGAITTNNYGIFTEEPIVIEDDDGLYFEGVFGNALEDTFIVYDSTDTDLEVNVDGVQVADLDNDDYAINVPLSLNRGATASGILQIYEDTDDGTNKTTFITAALAADVNYTLPPDDGDAGEQLQTNGSGVLTWEAAGSGSGAPTTVDYLVGTADGTLSNEIVVGTTPGGELGGSWGTPTIDDGLTVSQWTLSAGTIAAGSASANSWLKFKSGTVLTTAEDGAMELDDDTFYLTTDAGNRGYVPAKNCIRLDADYTLANSGAEQKVFNSPTNGRLTVETGTYIMTGNFILTGMSGTSGNLAFDALGGGTATIANWNWSAWGRDAAVGATGSAVGGSHHQAQQSGASVVTAATGTGMFFNVNGTFEVTGAGTMIPSVTLVTAVGTAVVETGSYFCVERIGSTSMTNIGQWD